MVFLLPLFEQFDSIESPSSVLTDPFLLSYIAMYSDLTLAQLKPFIFEYLIRSIVYSAVTYSSEVHSSEVCAYDVTRAIVLNDHLLNIKLWTARL
jgi:hypothetical protein